jgi:hypothetical protein
MTEGLVGGDGFPVDASLIRPEATRPLPTQRRAYFHSWYEAFRIEKVALYFRPDQPVKNW